jgi:Family of unknown function (DUF6178)
LHHSKIYQEEEKIETRYSNMTTLKKTRSIGLVRAEKNAETILSRLRETEEPMQLVQSLAAQDFVVAWNVADDEQRVDLLRLGAPEQTDLLVDLSCWEGDHPNLEALEQTYKPLVLSSLDGAIYALDAIGEELRTLLLKRNATVHLLEDRNEQIQVPETSELLACSDGYYFIEFPDPDAVTDVERALINALLHKPFEEYQRELECVRHDFVSELEESAYRWRTGRLTDYGFSTREEAISLLAPRSAEEARRMAISAPELPLLSDTRLPVLYHENIKGSDFLDNVLEGLGRLTGASVESENSTIGAELASMTNRYFTAAGIDIGDVEAMSQGVTWARDMLSLGLYEAADGVEEEGVRLMAILPPGVLFQVGIGLLYPIQRKARSLLNDHRLVAGVFDPPYRIGLGCMARDIPCLWPPIFDGSADTSHSLFEPVDTELAAFSTRGQVERAEQLIEEAKCLPDLLFEGIKCTTPLLRETPASILVLTALANAAGDRAPTAKPVTPDEARVFSEQVLAIHEDQLLSDALAVLAPLIGADPIAPADLSTETDPASRLLIRLILIARARLGADAAHRVVLIENV